MANLETILSIKVEGTSDMVKFKDEIDKTQKELKDLKAQQKAAGEEGSKFSKNIVEQETKLKALKKGLVGQKNDLIKVSEAAKITGKSYNDLTKKNAALVVQLKKLADPLGKDAKAFQKLSGQINTNTQALTKMDAKMGRSQRNVGNYGGAIKGMGVQLGAAILAFKTLERVIGTFVDFEFQIKQVGVISGATAEEMKLLEKSAKDLGSSTAFTAGEVAGLQKELAKLGFDPTEINNMTSSVLDLAFAFGDDLGETATAVGSTLRQFNLDADEASRVTDVMAVAFANSSLDLQKFETAMAKSAPVANALGFSLEDTTAILGTLTNAGLDASTAGTSLKNIFLKLADPTGDLAKSLGRNITSVDELIPAMNELVASGIDVAGMLDITDKRSVTAFASMLAGTESITIMQGKLNDAAGTTKKFADVMRDSLKGQIDEVKSAAEGFAIELTDNLQPVLSIVMEVLKSVFAVLREIAPVLVSLTAGFVAYKVVVIASSVATKVWNAATIAMRLIAVATSGGVNGLTRAMRLLNIAVKANPIGLLVGGLVAGVALFASMAKDAGETEDAIVGLGVASEDLKNINDGLLKTQSSELANVRLLVKSIGDETLTREDRLKAVKDLNKIAGTNISNIKDEKKLAGELAAAYDLAVDAIKEKIILQSRAGKIEALVLRELELEEEISTAKEKKLSIMQKTFNLTDKEIALGKKVMGTRIENGKEIQNLIDLEIYVENERKRINDDNRTRSQNLKSGMSSMNVSTTAYGKVVQDLADKEQNLVDVVTAQGDVFEGADEQLAKLNLTTEEQTKKVVVVLSGYQQLQENVSQATTALQKAIVTNKGITKATNDLKKAKLALLDVDNKVKKVNNEISDSIEPVVDGLADQIDAINKTIAAENLQLDSMKKLEDAGAKLTKERIQQAMKIAKSQLDLALVTIQSSDESTKAQVDNINELKNKITGFQNDLGNLGAETGNEGFMRKTLFGSSEDGEAFTGEDLINSISTTIGQVMGIMSAVTQLQNEQMNTEIQGIEGAKETELKAIRETQEYKIASSEDQAKMEEKITKKHDAKILALKVAQFDRDKKMMKAQAIMSGAMAIMTIWSGNITGNPLADAIIKSILTAAQVAMTGIQVASINAQAPPTAELGGVMDDSFFQTGGMVNGKSHANGGEKFAVGGRVVELEGGEAVINKKSTAMFKPMLSQMNVAGGGRKFADGGMVMATDMMETQSLAMSNAIDDKQDQQVFLVESDVTSTQLVVKNIEAQATF